MHQEKRLIRSRGRVISALLIAAMLVIGLAGPLGVRPAAAQDIQTRMIIVHGATDLGKVEVHINDDEVANEFSYGDQTDWINVDPGMAQVWITRDRAGINYTVFNTVYPIAAGNDYYLVITDALVMGGVFDKSPLAADTARVQVTHASVDTPAINVVANSDKVDFATQLSFARSSEVVEVPAGQYDTEVKTSDSGTVLLTTPGGTVEAGKVYQYILIGAPGDEEKPLEFVALSTDASQNSGATPIAATPAAATPAAATPSS